MSFFMTTKHDCKCLLCNTTLKDTKELTKYVKRLEGIIEKHKEILGELEDIPEDIFPRICKDFEVRRAEASNKIITAEVHCDSENSSRDFKAR